MIYNRDMNENDSCKV